MRLSVTVGDLGDLKVNDPEGYEAMKARLEAAGRLLEAAGLPAHVEPENLDFDQIVSFDLPEGGFEALQRLAAWVWAEGKVPGGPVPEGVGDALVRRYRGRKGRAGSGFFARLLGGRPPVGGDRFDAVVMTRGPRGIFLPVEFDGFLEDSEGFGVPGGGAGSSVSLYSECARLAEMMGVPEGMDPDADETAGGAGGAEGGSGWRVFAAEALSCLRLRAAAEASMELGAAVVLRPL